MTYKLYCNGFWSGFIEKTNAIHVDFFIQLFEKVYNSKIELGTLESSDILLENTQASHSYRTIKSWMHTYLFSGESYIRSDKDEYSCILYGMRTHKNCVNVPLYIPYTICNPFQIQHPERSDIPTKDCVVIIRNPSGQFRNAFLQSLESVMNITYAGPYKNNCDTILSVPYNSQEFFSFIRDFKFVITMENSSLDTYITEKIMHGFLGHTIPVYWGSPRITDYFQRERFLSVQSEENIQQIIETMRTMTNEEWLKRVNTPIQTEFGCNYTIEQIAKQIQQVIFPNPFPSVRQTFFLCNPDFEPVRYERLLKLCATLNLKPYQVTFMCPTFKHTISDTIYSKYVKADIVRRVRHIPTRRAEVSLTLNTRYVYEYIEKSYVDGNFFVFESDVFLKPNWSELQKCVEALKNKEWSCINIGGADTPFGTPFIDGPHPYRQTPNRTLLYEHAKEDISTETDTIRFIRKFHTRCTDSHLFSYKGICQFVKYLQSDENYGVPFDYYMIDKLEHHMDFKYYWSTPSFFDQSSNRGLDASAIQKDTS